MYLPKIMIDRFGWPGFIAFAVPNVLGCAAFGYVVKTAERSRRMIETHVVAMIHFSHVTIAYHAFFLGYITRFFGVEPAIERVLCVALPVVVILASMVLVSVRTGAVLVATCAAWGAGVVALVFYGSSAFTTIPMAGSLDSNGLLPLAPVLCFGFLLCPYFDLTFHRAIQQAPSHHAFVVFGIGFAIMLFLTIAMWFNMSQWWPLAITHVIVQSFLTILLHVRALDREREPGSHKDTIGTGPTMLEAAGVGVLLALILKFVDNSLATGEDFYLRFLVFYGLVFPAYTIVFMGPRSVGRSRRNLLIFAAFVLIAAAFYEIGFIHEMLWALTAPMAAVVIWLGLRLKQEAPAP